MKTIQLNKSMESISKAFSKIEMFCLPAKVYLLLFLAALFMGFMSDSWTTIFISIIFGALWTLFLNYLCRHGYKIMSWILVLLPFVIAFFRLLYFYNQLRIQSQMTKKMQKTASTSPPSTSMGGMMSPNMGSMGMGMGMPKAEYMTSMSNVSPKMYDMSSGTGLDEAMPYPPNKSKMINMMGM